MPEPTRPADHQAGQHRPELLDDRRAHQPADHRAGAELVEREAGLQRQHHAGEHAGQQHDRQRADADRVELLDDVAKVERAGTPARAGTCRPCGRIPGPPGAPTSAIRRNGRATSALAPDQAQIAAAQLLDPIAERRRLLELEVGCRRLHLRPQLGDVRLELGLRAERVVARRAATVT